MTALPPPEAFGPVYPTLGATVQKFRRMVPPDGIKDMPRQMVLAYAAAVEKAILGLQQSELRRVLVGRAPHCASGTAHTCGRKISAAVRQAQNAALLSYPAKVRRERTDDEWRALYAAAMKEKRALERQQIAA